MFVDFSIRTISIVIWAAPSSFALCEGNLMHKPCCIGEEWNVKEGKCKACPKNHFGKNCTFTCSVPEYGYRCRTGSCKCNRISCNVNISSPNCVASQTTSSLTNRTLFRFLSADTINSTATNFADRALSSRKLSRSFSDDTINSIVNSSSDRDFSIRTISIVIWAAPSSFALCEGNLMHKPCCVGEEWNVKEGKCKACPKNHFGKNCTFTCSVPEYGYRCSTGSCKCNRISCNVNISSPNCVASQTTSSLTNRTLFRFLSADTINSTATNFADRDVRSTSKHTIYAILPTTSLLTRQNNTVELSSMKRKDFPIYIVLGCGIVVCTLIVFQCLTIIRKKITKGHRQRSRDGKPQDPVYSEIILN